MDYKLERCVGWVQVCMQGGAECNRLQRKARQLALDSRITRCRWNQGWHSIIGSAFHARKAIPECFVCPLSAPSTDLPSLPLLLPPQSAKNYSNP